MTRYILLALLLCPAFSYSQRIIDWDGTYQLQLSDFQSPLTEIAPVSVFGVNTGGGIDFAFHMSNTEFMFTRNFNAKVNCSFKPDVASLIAPDSATALCLLDFARYEFDLQELYARKFRKRLYEEKGAFSNVGFFRPVYDEIQKQYIERRNLAVKKSDLGRDKALLAELHQLVLTEIGTLADFCKACKPAKKKKA